MSHLMSWLYSACKRHPQAHRCNYKQYDEGQRIEFQGGWFCAAWLGLNCFIYINTSHRPTLHLIALLVRLKGTGISFGWIWLPILGTVPGTVQFSLQWTSMSLFNVTISKPKRWVCAIVINLFAQYPYHRIMAKVLSTPPRRRKSTGTVCQYVNCEHANVIKCSSCSAPPTLIQ